MSNNFARNNLRWNFTDVIINANKVNPENLLAVRLLWEIQFYKVIEGPITALQTLDCDWSLDNFIEADLSKLTDSNQIFSNNFVSIHYHLCKISTQIIECKILFHKIFIQWTLYNYLIYDEIQ